ncbi:hypothetical protein [Burkholderia ubonensis]|uniref:hypothetical protein n=1 Tax=Burkholderia ubonensis TaxID=101571 RepID=UPI0012F8777E|nr:hypothetical protein [Burkholderia ubonensis]
MTQPEELIKNSTSYWATFYCAILKAIRYQKNLQFTWGASTSLQDYRGELRQSGFFRKMKDSLLNHAFEYVMADFLKTNVGISHFKNLCLNILKDFDINDFEITLMNVFKVGSDTEIHHARINYNNADVQMLLPNGLKAWRTSVIAGYNINGTLQNSDLFILISDGRKTVGFVGEVEGNHGEKLYRPSYYEKGKGKYCTFGVSVSDKMEFSGNSIKGNVSLNKSNITGRWILNFSKSHYYIKDYNHAIENLQGLVDGHFGHLDFIEDAGHGRILGIIKDNWSKDVVDLISALEEIVDFAFSSDNFHYQESIDGKIVYRPSTLMLPDQPYLYSIEENGQH